MSGGNLHPKQGFAQTRTTTQSVALVKVCLRPDVVYGDFPNYAGIFQKEGGGKSQTQLEVYIDKGGDDLAQSQPSPPQFGSDKAKRPAPQVEAETKTTSLVVATQKTEERSGHSQPSSGAKRGKRSEGRRKKTGKHSTARDTDDDYTPSTRYLCATVFPCVNKFLVGCHKTQYGISN